MAEKETKVLEAENKPKKAKKEKNKGRIKNAWNGFKSEFKKISWPSWTFCFCRDSDSTLARSAFRRSAACFCICTNNAAIAPRAQPMIKKRMEVVMVI